MMMNQFNIGEKATVLDDDIQGVVIAISGNVVTIETAEGFHLAYDRAALIPDSTTDFKQLVGKFGVSSINKDLPAKNKNIQKPKSKKEIPAPEFDLHIEKLVQNFRGMSNYDILTLQLDTAKRHIEFALRNRIPKIILIHGVGEGVLKTELDYLLARYEQIDFRSANFQKYGQGATEVYFIQNLR
jgi:hypothetical protein